MTAVTSANLPDLQVIVCSHLPNLGEKVFCHCSSAIDEFKHRTPVFEAQHSTS